MLLHLPAVGQWQPRGEPDSWPLLCFGPNKFAPTPGVTQIDRDSNRYAVKIQEHFNY
jgi:hypothetical protein